MRLTPVAIRSSASLTKWKSSTVPSRNPRSTPSSSPTTGASASPLRQPQRQPQRRHQPPFRRQRQRRLRRLRRHHGLDSTFGVGGKVATSFPGGLDTANDVAVQSDGKIVVAGSSGSDFALTRYNTNGTLDATFGTGGRVNTDFPTGMGGLGNALVIQPDGKIVVAGQATDPTSPTNTGFALVRYNTNGSLDTSFDGDGRVVTFISRQLLNGRGHRAPARW